MEPSLTLGELTPPPFLTSWFPCEDPFISAPLTLCLQLFVSVSFLSTHSLVSKGYELTQSSYSIHIFGRTELTVVYRASLVAQRLQHLPAMWRPGFDPWVGKIPWRRAWQPTPVFLPGESPWTEEPGGLQSAGLQRVGHDWVTSLHFTSLHRCQQTHKATVICNSLHLLLWQTQWHNSAQSYCLTVTAVRNPKSVLIGSNSSTNRAVLSGGSERRVWFLALLSF